MSLPQRIAGSALVDRSQPLAFTWNGVTYTGYAGDTLASALLANGVRRVARSFKYHRPRGVMTVGAAEPNAIVQLESGAYSTPNLRATQVELYEGLAARSVNCWPGPDWDVGAVTGWFARLLPAGFYYKTFMWPRGLWHTYERVIRQAAGFGTAPSLPDADRYDHMNTHTDVLVVGAGPSGLSAALAAARMGQRVLLIDEDARLGGSLLHGHGEVDGQPALTWVDEVLAELQAAANVRILSRTSVFGFYRENFLVALERRTDHLSVGTGHGPRQRQWRIRAGQVVLATGAIERPLVFGNNDRPGVMLSGAVSAYIRRYGVLPGQDVVLFTNNDSAYTTALDLIEAGAQVRVLVDVRATGPAAAVTALRGHGVEVLEHHVVVNVLGTRQVSGVEIAPRVARRGVSGAMRVQPCDLVAVSGGFNPAVHLHAHTGARPKYDEALACFVPGDPVEAECSVGAAAGLFDLDACLASGFEAGQAAALASGARRGRRRRRPEAPPAAPGAPIEALWVVPEPDGKVSAVKRFVDLQNDTTAADLTLAVREGYRSIEHVKRYTALGFGTDQGKLGNVNGMGIVAEALAAAPGSVGTTTYRPPWTPVSFGAVAGRHVGALLDPVRKTAMHGWHEQHGALFENVGQWLRPWYYPRPGESMAAAVNRECRAVRGGVGMLDATTLGKIDVRGADAGTFLERIYTNGWRKLAVGRARYGLMLGEDGMVMDDGVSARLAEDRYYMTTTTGGAAHVLGWMERWLQTEWPDLDVYLTSVTDQWATVAVAGPDSRAVLERICDDIDLTAAALPFMAFAEGHVAGLPARVFRVSFSGELAFEVNVAATAGQHLWDAIHAAGEAFGITPYGTETMHVLRAEKGFVIVGQDTDGSVTPHDLGMSWIVSRSKDFIGRRSLARADTTRADRKQLVGLRTLDPQVVLPEGAQLVDGPFTQLPVPMVGHVTSSYWSATLGRSIALALVKGGAGRHGDVVHAPLADGRLVAASIGSPVFYDARGVRQNG